MLCERGEREHSQIQKQMSHLRAKFRFEAENDDEISFEKGDYLIVEKVVDGDWLSGISIRDGCD